MTDMTIRWRLVLNIHLRDGLTEAMEDFAASLEHTR